MNAKKLLLLPLVLIACSSNQTKNEEMEKAEKAKKTQYRKEVSIASSKLYDKKYKKWNCQTLESRHSKIKSRLDRLMDKDKETREISSERKKKLDIALSAIDMAMDTCEDDPALLKKEKDGVTINNENNININNN